MNTIDEGLPRSLQSFINVLGSVIFTLILISYSIPYMLIVFLPVMVLYYLVQVMKEYWPLIGCQRSGDSVPTCNGSLLPCSVQGQSEASVLVA